MKKSVLTISFLLFTFYFSIAQKLVWANSFECSAISSHVGFLCTELDATGNIYLAGIFKDTVDLDPGPGITILTSKGADDIFIAKYSPTGNYIWAKQIGGINSEIVSHMKIYGAGNICLTGYFSDTVDFDPGTGVSNLYGAGSNDIFLAKLDASGNFLWANHIGGIGNDVGSSLDIDLSGNIFLTGVFTDSIDFDPSAGNAYLASAGSTDVFFAKYSAAGNYMWARNIRGAGYDYGMSISVGALGNVFVTGTFVNTADFDPKVGISFNITSNGMDDIFIAKYDSLGNYVWAKQIGGLDNESIDYGRSTQVDAGENLYVIGEFYGIVDFNPDTGVVNLVNLDAVGTDDFFIAKYSASGNYLWANNFGNSNLQSAGSIQLDASGNVYVTGGFTGTVDFDPGIDSSKLSSAGGFSDVFVGKYDAFGKYIWAKNMGSGTAYKTGVSMKLDASDNIHLVGEFTDAVDFDPSLGTAIKTANGTNGYFMAKYCSSTLSGTVSYSGGNVNNGYAKLYHYRTGKHMDLLDSVPLDASGQFTFNHIDDDSMFVYAYSNTPGTLPTYNGDTCEWVIGKKPLISCGTDNIVIKLDEVPPLTGSATVSGTINKGSGYKSPLAPGDPVGGIDVGIRKKPKLSMVGMTKTDASGNYTFSNIEPGDYQVYVDIPGLPLISTYNIAITGTENITGKNFIADSTSIYANGANSTDINEERPVPKKVFFVYPNPFNDAVYVVNKSGSTDESVVVSIADITGKIIYSEKIKMDAQAQLDLSEIQAGLYFIEIKHENTIEQQKIIKLQ